MVRLSCDHLAASDWLPEMSLAMNKRTKVVLWLAGIAVAVVIALTLGSTLWELYAVRSGVRFSVQQHEEAQKAFARRHEKSIKH